MELEKQVCSLELAKRLKELGVRQESLCWWVEPLLGKWVLTGLNTYRPYRQPEDSRCLAAFTVAELGEMLPPYFSTAERGYHNLALMKLDDGRWEVMYKVYKDVALVERADIEADARAKMLVYLLEKGLINLQSVS